MDPTVAQRERYEIAIRQTLQDIDSGRIVEGPEMRLLWKGMRYASLLAFTRMAVAEGLLLSDVVDVTLFNC